MLKKQWDLSFLTGTNDRMDVFFLAGGKILGAIIQGTHMINAMRSNHELGIIETLALGHAYLAAGLLTRSLTGDERIALQVDCSGPLGGLSVEANARGDVRGYLQRKEIAITAPLDSFNLAPFIGIGFLKITKFLKDTAQPFTGQVILQTGNLAKDLAHYFLTSEQIPSSFTLSVKFDRQGRVTGAGGLLLQALPGTDADMLASVADKTEALPSLGGLLEAGADCAEILERFFASYDLRILAGNPVRFYCHCSKEHYRAYLQSLPGQERQAMLTEGNFPVVVTCFNCNSAYDYSRDEIQTMG